jgi:hypothetical protein
MKLPTAKSCWFVWIALATGVATAQRTQAEETKKAPEPARVVLPKGVTEEMFAPPPMPQFMLDQNARRLSPEEMAAAALEAAKRVRKPAAAITSASAPATTPSGPAQ